VHIADVSHFVTPGDSIDDQAKSRATTVYLVDKVSRGEKRLPSNFNLNSSPERKFAKNNTTMTSPNTDYYITKWAYSSVEERLTTNQEVAGSIPATLESFFFFCSLFLPLPQEGIQLQYPNKLFSSLLPNPELHCNRLVLTKF
jgi:RNB domain